jgi:hypothetical protein|nr:DUF2500 domain-containing protein [uncultured Blautia sp.]
MFYIFNVLFSIIFFCILALIIYNIVKNISTWNQNNHSERLTVPAKIVAKRTKVSQHQQPNAGDATGAHGFTVMSSTSYYVTFELENGERMELSVKGPEYGMLAEGDTGALSYQGTRYLGFERK